MTGQGETSSRSRRARLGSLGEQAAARLFLSRGFSIVACNLRNIHGEIDLLLRRRRLYVAVEVKTRAGHPAPERLVEKAQLERLERALVALAPHLRPRPRSLRIDVVAVTWRADRTEVHHFVAHGPFPPRFASDSWYNSSGRIVEWTTSPKHPHPPMPRLS